MGIPNLVYNTKFKSSFRYFWICGIIGILIDTDHVIAHIFSISNSRFAHPYIMLVVCIMLCFVCAYLGRLYFKFILIKNSNKFQNDLRFYYSIDRNKYRRGYKGIYELYICDRGYRIRRKPFSRETY